VITSAEQIQMAEIARAHGTPFYLFSEAALESALRELQEQLGDLPVRHWLSFKTSPVGPLVHFWRKKGLGVEVVSEFELLAALQAGFRPQDILVNGVGKASWLAKINTPNLNVNFDSLSECGSLAFVASKFTWRIGIRLAVSEQFDPDDPEFRGQFGMLESELQQALGILRRERIIPHIAHFHLRSNIDDADAYVRSMSEAIGICHRSGFYPRVLDIGGGLPVPGERHRDSHVETYRDHLPNLARLLRQSFRNNSIGVDEVWLENGRFFSGRGAKLVFRVRDIKARTDARYLICDGGRVNNALVSDWQLHEIDFIPPRDGPLVLTSVCGPTCMAYDWIHRGPLTVDIQVGDLIVWSNAGAYHIPWETRFSQGLAAVFWADRAGKIACARKPESFESWWGQWLDV
jgi:diaminopimelate decarboxylase